jgi:hypothetical protein
MLSPALLAPGTFIRHNQTRGYILEALPPQHTNIEGENTSGHRLYWVKLSQENPLESPYKVLSSQEFEVDPCQKTHTK